MKRKPLVAAICEILFVVWEQERINRLLGIYDRAKVLTTEWEEAHE